MVNCRRILELHMEGISQRTISSSTGHSRNTVSEVIQRARQRGIDKLNDTMTNHWLEVFLFPEKQAMERGYFPVDWEKVHKELQRKNVTLTLLHYEYVTEARENGKIPYAYRTFAENYGKYAKKYKLTMPIQRKPGESVEVDWAGSTLDILDRSTGEIIPAYLFIATLPYSQYSYVEAFLDMKTANWLIAHIHALEYFEGVPETMDTFVVIKTNDVFENTSFRLISSLIVFMKNKLSFYDAMKRFYASIIITVSFSSHTGDDFIFA